MKELRGLLAELSSNWLKRRKAQAPDQANIAKVGPQLTQRHVTPQSPRPRPAHKPKPISARDVASNM